MSLVDKIFAAGVVGCGGAGFPTHAKLAGSIEHFIVNAAECEPLLQTDKYIMREKAAEIVGAAVDVCAAIGAKDCAFVTKAAYTREVEALNAAVRALDADIRILALPSFYPLGDEQTAVFEATGRVVPPAGIPLDVGCVVSNVATLLCVYDAKRDIPFTHKYLTVTGEVASPCVVHIPVGAPLTECIRAAGGALTEDWFAVSGGPMMGTPMTRYEAERFVVTKTTSGILILRGDSAHARRNDIPLEHMLNRARSACIQCSLCTQLCPRYLLGHPLEPHKIMRRLSAVEDIDNISLDDTDIRAAALCCECGVCEIYACPMELQPRRVNALLKTKLAAAGVRYPKGEGAREPSSGRDDRNVPTRRAAVRAGVGQYYGTHAEELREVDVNTVTLPLKQHIGAPCEPTVKVGDKIESGALVGRCPEGKLGANLHSGIAGTVREVGECIIIEKDGDAV